MSASTAGCLVGGEPGRPERAWFYLVVVVLVVLGIAGGIFAGGIFTIILVPLALIVLLSGLGTR